MAMPAPRSGEAYHAAFTEALERVGLTPADLVAGLSDHEGAVRKGLRLLGAPLVGCGCHAIQLASGPQLAPAALGPRLRPHGPALNLSGGRLTCAVACALRLAAIEHTGPLGRLG